MLLNREKWVNCKLFSKIKGGGLENKCKIDKMYHVVLMIKKKNDKGGIFEMANV